MTINHCISYNDRRHSRMQMEMNIHSMEFGKVLLCKIFQVTVRSMTSCIVTLYI